MDTVPSGMLMFSALCQYDRDDKIIIAFVIIDPHWIIFIEVKSDHITEKVLPSLCIRTLHKPLGEDPVAKLASTIFFYSVVWL
jgi:hypothetical protein